jgi:TrmH family RNA methyltransferase
MGSIYRVPYFISDDLSDTVGELKKNGISVYAAHLKGQKSYDAPDYKNAAAFLIGNEGNGLSDELSNLADCYIRIPMEGQVESLNAAVSASILMYEVHRKRRSAYAHLV